MIFSIRLISFISSLVLLIVGCAQVPKEAGFNDVKDLVGQRADYNLRWNQETEADREVEKAIEALLKDELTAQAIEIRSEIRSLRNHLIMQRNLIDHYRNTVLPLREQIVDLMLKNYNYMLKGAFDLLIAKQQEFESHQKYHEAVRDYWIIRADMQRSLGGRLPTRMHSQRMPQPDTIETSTMNKQDMQENKMN